MQTKTSEKSKRVYFKVLRDIAYNKLYRKYSSGDYSYSKITVNNLVFNESCLAVARFKDYLILDDDTEFLRRFYPSKDSNPRLHKIFNFYETYSKIFPNYMILKENKYLYKNIRKKQKMIDAMNEIKREEEENRRKMTSLKNADKDSKNKDNNKELFTKKVVEEIKKFQEDAHCNCGYSDDDEDVLFKNSISISVLNKKMLIELNNKIPEKNYLKSSFKDEKDISHIKQNIKTDDKLRDINSFLCESMEGSETNTSIAKILNVLNDNKIYVADLRCGITLNEYTNNKKKTKGKNSHLNCCNKNNCNNNNHNHNNNHNNFNNKKEQNEGTLISKKISNVKQNKILQKRTPTSPCFESSKSQKIKDKKKLQKPAKANEANTIKTDGNIGTVVSVDVNSYFKENKANVCINGDVEIKQLKNEQNILSRITTNDPTSNNLQSTTKVNIIKGCQNIIIPGGHTVININSNYYNTENQDVKIKKKFDNIKNEIIKEKPEKIYQLKHKKTKTCDIQINNNLLNPLKTNTSHNTNNTNNNNIDINNIINNKTSYNKLKNNNNYNSVKPNNINAHHIPHYTNIELNNKEKIIAKKRRNITPFVGKKEINIFRTTLKKDKKSKREFNTIGVDDNIDGNKKQSGKPKLTSVKTDSKYKSTSYNVNINNNNHANANSISHNTKTRNQDESSNLSDVHNSIQKSVTQNKFTVHRKIKSQQISNEIKYKKHDNNIITEIKEVSENNLFKKLKAKTYKINNANDLLLTSNTKETIKSKENQKAKTIKDSLDEKKNKTLIENKLYKIKKIEKSEGEDFINQKLVSTTRKKIIADNSGRYTLSSTEYKPEKLFKSSVGSNILAKNQIKADSLIKQPKEAASSKKLNSLEVLSEDDKKLIDLKKIKGREKFHTAYMMKTETGNSRKNINNNINSKTKNHKNNNNILYDSNKKLGIDSRYTTRQSKKFKSIFNKNEFTQKSERNKTCYKKRINEIKEIKLSLDSRNQTKNEYKDLTDYNINRDKNDFNTNYLINNNNINNSNNNSNINNNSNLINKTYNNNNYHSNTYNNSRYTNTNNNNNNNDNDNNKNKNNNCHNKSSKENHKYCYNTNTKLNKNKDYTKNLKTEYRQRLSNHTNFSNSKFCSNYYSNVTVNLSNKISNEIQNSFKNSKRNPEEELLLSPIAISKSYNNYNSQNINNENNIEESQVKNLTKLTKKSNNILDEIRKITSLNHNKKPEYATTKINKIVNQKETNIRKLRSKVLFISQKSNLSTGVFNNINNNRKFKLNESKKTSSKNNAINFVNIQQHSKNIMNIDKFKSPGMIKVNRAYYLDTNNQCDINSNTYKLDAKAFSPNFERKKKIFD